MTRQQDEQEQTAEIEESVWVKFSTGFKKELAGLDVYSLKVFLYIGLSANFYTGEAYPGLRRIAKDIGMAVNTVRQAVEDLERSGLLTVRRRVGSGNLYQSVRYITIGTVSPDDTLPSQSVSPDDTLPRQSVSPDDTLPRQSVSPDDTLTHQGVSQDDTAPTGVYHENDKLYHENTELYHDQEGNLHNKNNKIKQEEDDDETKIAAKLRNLSRLYETTIGAMTPLMADLLRNAAIDYPAEWFEPAFEIAVRNNVRRWNYVETILDSWKRNGFGWKPESAASTREQRSFTSSFKPRRGQNGEDRPRYQIPEYSEAELVTIAKINRKSDL